MNLHLKTCAVANNNGRFFTKSELYVIKEVRGGKFCISGDDYEDHWVRVNDSNFKLI